MGRLTWRQRALYDDAFGRRVDRWFAIGACSGLLIAILYPAFVGIGAMPVARTLILSVVALYFLLAAWKAPSLATPFSLIALGAASAFVRFMPGVERVAGESAKNEEKPER